jgi:hypothetical protein
LNRARKQSVESQSPSRIGQPIFRKTQVKQIAFDWLELVFAVEQSLVSFETFAQIAFVQAEHFQAF